MNEPLPKRKPQGFATMTVEERRRIASLGGITAHKKGTAHQFTPEEASVASKKSHAARAANKIVRIKP